MFRWLRRHMSLTAAVAVAVLYAASILTHAVAVAFGPPPSVHCLTEALAMAEHTHGSKAHVHTNSRVHHPAEHSGAATHSEDEADAHPGKCCGLFSVNALTPHAEHVIAVDLRVQPDFPPLDAKLTGMGADRIDRPPNV
jgi:hypothetical protein